MQDAVDGQIEVLMVGHQPAEAGRSHRHAVIGPLARDDLFLLRLADGIVVVPDHLHGRVVGLRARIGKEHAGHGHRGLCQQFGGQFGHCRVGPVIEGVIVGQRLQGPDACGHQTRMAEAQRTAPQARHALDVAPPVFVLHVNAVAPGDHERPHGGVVGQIGERMQMGLDVLRGQFAGRLSGHGGVSSKFGDGCRGWRRGCVHRGAGYGVRSMSLQGCRCAAMASHACQ